MQWKHRTIEGFELLSIDAIQLRIETSYSCFPLLQDDLPSCPPTPAALKSQQRYFWQALGRVAISIRLLHCYLQKRRPLRQL
jgi:hypothetical protein